MGAVRERSGGLLGAVRERSGGLLGAVRERSGGLLGRACRAPVTPQAPDKPVPITAIFVGNVFLPLILLSEQTVTNLCVLFPVTGVFCNPMLLL